MTRTAWQTIDVVREDTSFRVAAGLTDPQYNAAPPFHPDARLPEMPFDEISSEPNAPYLLLRQLLADLGYDREHFGASGWNPLGRLIRPGQTVVLKPNFVLSYNAGGGDLFAVITHPSILRALVDYAFLALRGRGRLVIADAPQMHCQWADLVAATHLDAIRRFYRERFHFEIELYDLRSFALLDPAQPAYAGNRRELPGDPAGGVRVDLGRRSEFFGLDGRNFYGADYDRAATRAYHHGDVQRYQVSRTVLAADTVIFIPKMKVHKKVGVTLCLKGLVGMTTDKNCLVHYRVGTPRQGGDESPEAASPAGGLALRARRWLYDHALSRQTPWGDRLGRAALAGYRTLVAPVSPSARALEQGGAGDWHGNDTAWRMTADLAHILTFADADGRLHDTPQRRVFCVVDGIIGGEGCGPLSPDARAAGCLVVGEHPLAVDLAATRLMGFDVARFPLFDLSRPRPWHGGLESAELIKMSWSGQALDAGAFFGGAGPSLNFRPHPAWVGHMGDASAVAAEA
jgi:uncharacterized protein (DUF362 family)